MAELTFGDDRLQGRLIREEDRLSFELSDLANGGRWGRCGLLTLEVYSKAEFRAETFNTYRVDACEAAGETGAHVQVSDPRRGVRVGLYLFIEDGELVVRMPMSEVYEDCANVYRLFSVILLPGLMTAHGGGKLLLPLNTGMLCDPTNKPRLSDRFMIYGEQDRWELMVTLPVVAANSPDGGLMAMATGAPAETQCHVSTDGKGAGQVAMGMSLRQYWPDKVEFEPRVVRYVPINPQADLVGFTAKRLRRHVTEDLGKPTLAERAAQSPDLAYMLDAYIMKLFFAVQNRGIMMQDRGVSGGGSNFVQVMSFAEAKRNLQRLRDAGVDSIYTQMVGWNPRGHDGLWPTRFPIEDRLGGEKGFRELIAAGTEMGYRMNVHDNQKAMYRLSPDWDPDRVIRDQWGGPMGLGEWGGGTTFVISHNLPDSRERVLEEMRRLKALGLSGPGYLDGMANPPFRDYHPAHRGTRTDFCRGTVMLIESLKEVYGAGGTECGFLYGAIPADTMVTAGMTWHVGLCWDEWPVKQLQDQRVPLWDMTMSGLITLEAHGEHWNAVMECVLLGKTPRAEWSARPGVMPVLTDELIAKIKGIHDVAVKRFGRLAQLEITDYDAPADGVEQTIFTDGTEVAVDRNAGELTVDGERIERPDALKAKA